MNNNELYDMMQELGHHYPQWVNEAVGSRLDNMVTALNKIAKIEKKTKDDSEKVKKANNKVVDENTKIYDKVNKELLKYEKTVENLSRETTKIAVSLGKGDVTGAIDRFSSGMAGAVSTLGKSNVVFGLASASILGLGGAANFVITEMQRTKAAYSAMTEAGVFVQDGFDGLRRAAHAGNLSLEQLSAAAGRNTKAFLALGPQAGAIFSRMSIAFRQPESVARKLGMSIEDLNSFISDNLEMQRVTGMINKLSEVERKAATERQLRELTLYSSILGKSRKEMMEEAKSYIGTADTQNLAYRLADAIGVPVEQVLTNMYKMSERLSGMIPDEGTRNRLMNFATAVEASERGVLIHDQATREAMIWLQSTQPQLAASISDSYKQLANAVTPEEVEAATVRLATDLQEAATKIDHDLAANVMNSDVSPALKQLYDDLYTASHSLRGLSIEANVAAASNTLDGPNSPVLEAFGNAGELLQSMNTTLSEFVTDFTSTDGFQHTLTTINDSFKKLSDNVEEVANGIGSVASGNFDVASVMSDAGSGFMNYLGMPENEASRMIAFSLLGLRLGGAKGAVAGALIGKLWNQFPSDDDFSDKPIEAGKDVVALLGPAAAGFKLGGVNGAIAGAMVGSIFGEGGVGREYLNGALTTLGLQPADADSFMAGGSQIFGAAATGFAIGGPKGALAGAALMAAIVAAGSLSNWMNNDISDYGLSTTPQNAGEFTDEERISALQADINRLEAVGGASVEADIWAKKAELEEIRNRTGLSGSAIVVNGAGNYNSNATQMYLEDKAWLERMGQTMDQETLNYWKSQGANIPQMAKGGVAVGDILANIGEGGSPEMVMPLDPALHNLAKYNALMMVEYFGPFMKIQQDKLVYDLFRNNRVPLDEILSKSLDRFFFSKRSVSDMIESKSENWTQGDANTMTLMQAFGINSSSFGSGINMTGSGGMINPSSFGVTGVGAGSTDRAKQAMDFFMAQGLSREQAAGLVGNLQAESGAGLNTHAVGDGGRAFGIAQWHPDRQALFKKAFGKDIRQSTFEEQLQFIMWEFQNTEKSAFNRIKQATTASEAAVTVDKFYERSAGLHTDRRVNNANTLLNNYVTASDGKSGGTGASGWVMPTSGRVTSPFGPRNTGIPGASKFHKGVDIANSSGTPVVATKPGKVTVASSVGGYGNVIYLTHSGGYSSRYGHLSGFNVQVGQDVAAGQVIGAMGNTGVSSGPHLHFEIRLNDEARDPANFIPGLKVGSEVAQGDVEDTGANIPSDSEISPEGTQSAGMSPSSNNTGSSASGAGNSMASLNAMAGNLLGSGGPFGNITNMHRGMLDVASNMMNNTQVRNALNSTAGNMSNGNVDMNQLLDALNTIKRNSGDMISAFKSATGILS